MPPAPIATAAAPELAEPGDDRAHHRRPPSATTPLLWVAGVAVAAIALIPLVYLVVRAQEVGVARAWEIATSPRALGLLWRTTLLAVTVTAASAAIAVPVAWLTVRSDLPFRRFWVVATALPLAIPTYVGGFAFLGALGPNGVLSGWLDPLGISAPPRIYGFWGAWAVLTLFSYPYMLLTVRAGIRHLDPSLEEVSRTLGRSRTATFLRVILPQLRPSLVAGGLLVALYTLSDFGAVSMLRFDSFTRAIYIQYGNAFDRSMAAVLSLCLVALTLAVLSAELVSRHRNPYHRLHGGGARAAAMHRLGRWRWPATGMLSALVGVALVLPLAVISTWLARGIEAGEPLRLTTTLVGNSLQASALGAIASVVLAWPIAVLSVRHRGFLGRAVEGACWLGYSLPGIVVALSLVPFALNVTPVEIMGVRVVPDIYQTHWNLTLAYVVLFLPQALGAIRASLLQVNPSLEEASRLLGHGPIATYRRIVLPLARPGLLAGGALVFLTCMKELPATLLLAPTGFPTLSTQVWNATTEAFFARAAAPAMALILLSSIPMAILVLRDK